MIDIDLNKFAISTDNDLPKFPGSRATEIIKSLVEIESTFLKQIQKLMQVDYNILDVLTGGGGIFI